MRSNGFASPSGVTSRRLSQTSAHSSLSPHEGHNSRQGAGPITEEDAEDDWQAFAHKKEDAREKHDEIPPDTERPITALPYPGNKVIKTFPDGARYAGEWKYGKAHGEGQIKYGSHRTLKCPPCKSKSRHREQAREAAFPQPTREIDTQVLSAIHPLSWALLLTVQELSAQHQQTISAGANWH